MRECMFHVKMCVRQLMCKLDHIYMHNHPNIMHTCIITLETLARCHLAQGGILFFIVLG